MKLYKRSLLSAAAVCLAVIINIAAQAGNVDADAASRPSLLVVGSYHMANPGLDRARSEVDDVLSPKRQAEIMRVVEMLGEFRPTKIAIECAVADQPKIDAAFQKYLSGEAELKRGEEQQIGFRLAKKAGLKTLYCIDWNDYPPGDFSEYDYHQFAETDPELKTFSDERMRRLQAAVSERDKIFKGLSVPEQLRYLNRPENLDRSHRSYFEYVRIGRGQRYIGANYLSHWYGRNMKILANLIRITDAPRDRILVIYGAGHAKLLNQFAGESGFYRVESPLKYLKK